jgi:Protein of unknown function (DUF3025)
MALVHVRGWDPQFIAGHALLWPLASAARALEACVDWPSLEELDALHAARAAERGARALQFVAQEKPPRRSLQPVALGERYDARIALCHEVPTRARNWHDLLNALCFATFPNSKLALHTRQYHALCCHVPEGALRMPSARTPEQDALTLFDEGGVVIAATADAERALQAAAPHDYATSPAFAAALTEYTRLGQARVVPFGHALFEHMVEGLPCPGASARVLALPELPADDDALLGLVDAAFARCLGDPTRFRASREAFHLRLE